MRSQHGFKGPAFESFLNPPVGSGKNPNKNRSLPPGKEYCSHSGKASRLRRLRQSTRHLVDSRDPEVIAAVERVREAVKDDPLPEYTFLYLLFQATETSNSTGASIPEVVGFMIDQWVVMKEKLAEMVKEEESGGSETKPDVNDSVRDGGPEGSA